MNRNVRRYVACNVLLVLQNWIVQVLAIREHIVMSIPVLEVMVLRVITGTPMLDHMNIVKILKLDREYL